MSYDPIAHTSSGLQHRVELTLSSLSIATGSDGIAVVALNLPGKSVNTLCRQMLDDLAQAMMQIESAPPAGVVFTSAKPRSFIAGADLGELTALPAEALEQYLEDGQSIFTRIQNLPCPTAAAIGGTCLGGGFELTLACDARVAADEPNIRIGLPEVRMGLVPGWGGTVRVPRLIGLRRALALLVAGTTLPPNEAAALGLVDELAPAGELVDAARRLIAVPPQRKKVSVISRTMAALGPTRRRIFATMASKAAEQTHDYAVAARRVIDVVQTGWEHGPQPGFDAERATLAELLHSPEAQKLIHDFLHRHDAKKTAPTVNPAV